MAAGTWFPAGKRKLLQQHLPGSDVKRDAERPTAPPQIPGMPVGLLLDQFVAGFLFLQSFLDILLR